ncbi:MAG: substrate-binding domain-containing protein [Bryobacteraceae bacterium]
MMRRLWTTLLFVCLILSACRGSRKKVIGVVPKGTSHLFWQTVQAGAIAAGRDLGVEIEWNGAPMETDYSRQIQIVDSMIARHVDGLVVAAADRTALVQPLDRAAKAGVPVVVFDSGLDSTNYVTFIATNNFNAGQLAARKLAAMISGKGKVAVVMHAPGSASTMERERGFDEVMAKEFPSIEVVARQFGMSDRAKSRSAAENMLAAHPDLNGMFASSEPSSVGASLAIKSRGLSERVWMVAFDSSDGMIEDLKSGAIDAMVVQNPFKIGYDGVKTLVEFLNGKTPPKQIDLNAQVLIKEDLDKPDVKKLLSPDLDKYLK